jgi:hypothetical protein
MGKRVFMMNKKMVLLYGAMVVMLMAALFTSASETKETQNKGAEEMVLEGGAQGRVPFPHLRHQTRLADCRTCHDLFPQVKGSIDKLKAEGSLKSKQVMNIHCIKCHRTEKRAGNPSGPTTCSKCHQKE